MKNVLIFGASGMVGSEVLTLCLETSAINNVTVFVRKPLDIKHKKLNEIIHNDYVNFDSTKEHLKNIDICFYCIGVYTGTVSKEEFNKVTIDMPFELAKALKSESPQVIFSLLSGAGADSTEKSRVLFAKAKGIAENKLIGLNFNQLNIFRPGYIYPVKPRKEPNIWYRIFRLVYKPLKGILKNSSVTSEQLAAKMVNVALEGNKQLIFENIEII